MAAQADRDSVPADSIRHLSGITVDVARPTLTTGGSSAVVIDLDSIVHTPAPTLEDVVRALPLIQVRMNSRGEAQPALRGSEDRQIAVLMDGVPLTLGWDHRTDMSIVPLTAARNVTLVRGLSSVLYGPNTLGGVLEIGIARSDRAETPVDPLSVGLSLDETGGTRVSAVAGHVVGAADQWVLRGGGGFLDRPGVPLPAGLSDDADLRAPFLSDGDLRLNSDTRRVDGFLATSYRSREGTWASASLSAIDVERGVPPEAHQDAPRLWRYPEQRRLVGSASAGTGERSTGLGRGALEASLGLDVGTTSIDRFVSEAYRTVADTEDSSDRVVSVRVLAQHRVGAASEVRAAATFTDVGHDEVLSAGPTDAYGQRVWSLGVETGVALGASARTRVSLGAVLDGSDTHDAAGRPTPEAVSDYGLRVGATSLVSPGVLLHAALSRRARFPSLREQYSAALGRFEPNPSLGAETLVGSEGGITLSGPVGELQVVGFHHRLDDGIVRTSVTGSDGVPRFMRVNRAEVRSTGVELLLAGRLSGTSLTGDLTLQSVTGFDASGDEVSLEYEPTILGRARVDAPMPSALRGSAELRFVGEQYCENPEVGGLQKLGASHSIDLGLRRRFELAEGGALRRVMVLASLLNATDEAVFDQCGLPRPGRLFQIQLRLF